MPSAFQLAHRGIHTHRLWHSGTIGAQRDSHNWTDGYTHLVFALVKDGAGNERTYLLLHKSGNGHINIHRLYTDGTLSGRLHHHNWTSGWTTITSWGSGASPPRTFVLLLKKSTGRIVTHEVLWNGALSSRLEHTNWTSNYTDACVLDQGPTSRALLINKYTSGDIKVHRLTTGGYIGDAIDPYWLVENNGSYVNTNYYFSKGDISALRRRYGDP